MSKEKWKNGKGQNSETKKNKIQEENVGIGKLRRENIDDKDTAVCPPYYYIDIKVDTNTPWGKHSCYCIDIWSWQLWNISWTVDADCYRHIVVFIGQSVTSAITARKVWIGSISRLDTDGVNDLPQLITDCMMYWCLHVTGLNKENASEHCLFHGLYLGNINTFWLIFITNNNYLPLQCRNSSTNVMY